MPAESLHENSLTLRYKQGWFLNLVFILIRSISHRIHLYQHSSLQVLIGCQMGGTATASDCLDVFIQLAQPTTEGGVKLILYCVVLRAQSGSNCGPLIAWICPSVPRSLCSANNCCSWR